MMLRQLFTDSQNNEFGDCVDQIYSIELQMTDTRYTRSASNLDTHLEIDSEDRLRTKLYDK